MTMSYWHATYNETAESTETKVELIWEQAQNQEFTEFPATFEFLNSFF